jgi:hypothetical protein
MTPDLQPVGLLSLNYQQEHPALGSPCLMQAEIGVTRYLDVNFTHDFTLRDWSVGVMTGLQSGPHLFAAGVANWGWGPGAGRPQPFFEYGYSSGPHHAEVGEIWVKGRGETLLGYAYDATPDLQLLADWQSGADNYSTLGVSYAFTPSLSLSPALWHENAAPHRTFPIAILTWSVQVF